MVVCAAAVGLLVQFLLQQIEELCAVDDVVGQADAERVLSGHVIEQYRPKKKGQGMITAGGEQKHCH